MDYLCYLWLVFGMLSRPFIAALWSPAGKGLTSWLFFVMFNCYFVTFPCGILGQLWYLIVSFPDLCRLLTLLDVIFHSFPNFIKTFCKKTAASDLGLHKRTLGLYILSIFAFIEYSKRERAVYFSVIVFVLTYRCLCPGVYALFPFLGLWYVIETFPAHIHLF